MTVRVSIPGEDCIYYKNAASVSCYPPSLLVVNASNHEIIAIFYPIPGTRIEVVSDCSEQGRERHRVESRMTDICEICGDQVLPGDSSSAVNTTRMLCDRCRNIGYCKPSDSISDKFIELARRWNAKPGLRDAVAEGDRNLIDLKFAQAAIDRLEAENAELRDRFEASGEGGEVEDDNSELGRTLAGMSKKSVQEALDLIGKDKRIERLEAVSEARRVALVAVTDDSMYVPRGLEEMVNNAIAGKVE